MLKLKRYFFPVLSVIANPQFNPDARETHSKAEVDVNGNFGQHGEDTSGFMAMINITVKPPEEDAIIPYEIELSAVGFFQVDEDTPDDYVQTRLPLDALGVLHSSSREMITMLTSRGPWDEFVLPIHFFSPEGLGLEEEKPATKKRTASSKKKSKK
jgi:preprotein translocase subunit SecB